MRSLRVLALWLSVAESAYFNPLKAHRVQTALPKIIIIIIIVDRRAVRGGKFHKFLFFSEYSYFFGGGVKFSLVKTYNEIISCSCDRCDSSRSKGVA